MTKKQEMKIVKRNKQSKQALCLTSLQRSLCCVRINVHFCSARFMLKRTKPELVSSNSSARLLEDVVVDKDNHDHLIQSSRVRLSFAYHLISS